MRAQPEAAHIVWEEQRECVGVFVGMNAKAVITLVLGRLMEQCHVGQRLFKQVEKPVDLNIHDLCDQPQ